MSNNFDPTNDLRRLWSIRLYEEYQHINKIHRLKLYPANIIIEHFSSKWGDYDTQKNTIRINETLLKEFSWDTTIEILKHEMIHQYIHQHRLKDESPHGKTFRVLAQNFGLASWAMNSSIDIPRDPTKISLEKGSDEQNRLLKKAEKLLALAESSSEHEAALAMQRVRELYSKYNLEKISQQSGEDYFTCLITRKKQRIEAVESLIFSVLIEFFFVKVITRSIYDHKEDTYYKGAEVLGKLENVKLAEYVYHFLWNQATTRSKKISCQSNTGMLRRDFRYGLIRGFATKLRQQNLDDKSLSEKIDLQTKQDIYALIVSEDQSLSDFENRRHPDLISQSYGPGRPMNRDAYNAGFTEGKQLNLHRGLQRGTSEFGGLLK